MNNTKDAISESGRQALHGTLHIDDDASRVSFFPKFGLHRAARPLLKCENSWDRSSTLAFNSNEFEDLWLRVLPHQNMSLPDLGMKAQAINRLSLLGVGTISGIEQFKNLEDIRIDSFPKNGIDFKIFTKLKCISTTWDKKFRKEIFSLEELQGLYIDGFNGEDCRLYRALPNLLHAGFDYGRLTSLDGLEACEGLNSLGLGSLRNFSELNDLRDFKKITSLDLYGLPKLVWDMSLSDAQLLQTLGNR